jgi:hypothetical protein
MCQAISPLVDLVAADWAHIMVQMLGILHMFQMDILVSSLPEVVLTEKVLSQVHAEHGPLGMGTLLESLADAKGLCRLFEVMGCCNSDRAVTAPM